MAVFVYLRREKEKEAIKPPFLSKSLLRQRLFLFELTVGAFPMRERGVKPTIREAD